MSSDLAPLLIGFAAAGLLLGLIGMVLVTRRVLDRIRSRRRRRSRESERWETSQEWVYRPRARQARAEPSDATSKAEASVREPSADEQDSRTAVDETVSPQEETLATPQRQREVPLSDSDEAAEQRAAEIIEDARRSAQRLLEEAELEAKEIVAAADRQREALLRETEVRAEQTAGEITVDAHRRAQELLKKAKLEAKEIVAAAVRERTRLLSELARVAEETRMGLSSFLHGVLEEVEDASSLDDPPANVRALSQARGMKTSAGTDE